MVGQVLKDKRIELGYTMKNIQELTGLFPANYHLYESGKMVPTNHKTVVKLANALNLDEDYFEALVCLDSGRIPNFILNDKDRMYGLYEECMSTL